MSGREGRPSKQPDVRDWLTSYLAKTSTGLRLANDIRLTGAALGYGWMTIQRAKKTLGLMSVRKTDMWFWYNPHDIREGVAEAISASLGALESQTTSIVQIASDRARERVKDKTNRTGYKDEQLARFADGQFCSKVPLERAIVFIQGLARSSPVDPPFNDQDVALIVTEQYEYLQKEKNQNSKKAW